jgi:hypothetical protein
MNEGRPVRKRSGSFAILESRVPVEGRDYPADRAAFERTFTSERACRDYLEALRFPHGFTCEGCGERAEPWRSGTGLVACRACRRPVSLTEGTLFQGSTLSLRRWLRALWETAERDACLSTAALQLALGVKSSLTAAEILERIRSLMAEPAQAALGGEVSISTTQLDLDGTPQGRPTVVMALGDSTGRPRVRLRVLGRGHAREIARFVIDNVERGSGVLTAPWRGFTSLAAAGYRHRVAGEGDAGVEQQARQLWSLIELWLWSAPATNAYDLQGALDDFAFHFNRREYPKGLLFYRLMVLAVTLPPPEARPEQALA